jgi:hypothetical protein
MAASLEEVWARFINETLRTLSLSEVDLPTDPEAIRILAKELGFSALDRTKVVSFFKSKKAAENAAAALREPNEEGIQGEEGLLPLPLPPLLFSSSLLYLFFSSPSRSNVNRQCFEPGSITNVS